MTSRKRDGATKSGIDAAKRALLKKLLRGEGSDLPVGDRIMPGPSSSSAPLSFAQERLWFLEQLDPGTPVYNISRALRLRGPIDHSALANSVNEIVRRHEILRATFQVGDDAPVQKFASKLTLEMPLIDLSQLPKNRRQSEVARTVAAESGASFDLTRGPLLRLRLVKLGKADHVLLVAAHQIVCDGWSMRLILRELELFYRSHACDRLATLPELPIQYRDYASWQRNWIRGAELKAQLAYWQERLRDSLPGISLPADRPRPARQTFRGARLPLIVPKTAVQGLGKLGGAEGATLFMTLMAAFNVLLWRYADQDDIAVGFPVAHRARVETQDLVGFFVNTLVLRTDLSGSPTFRELLRRTREHCHGAMAHQDLPFDKLVDELARERDLSRNPLFQVMFAYQSNLAAELNLPRVKTEPVELAAATSKFDLTLSLTEGDDILAGFLEYNSDLFERSTIERMARHFLTLLRGIVANPAQRIGALPLLGNAERKRILVEWNHAELDYPKRRCMHELFEAQAKKSPNAIAVEWAGEKLTYRQLNSRANQLAHYLQRLGVGAEKPAGVCVERSLEMVVGLLGVLKAGGAYVPLDPKYPRERISFMLEDAQIEVLLTLGGSRQSSVIGDQLSDWQVNAVCLDRDWRTIARESPRNLTRAARAHNLAYVIYTSGSTGQPKGVAIEHRNAVAFLHWAKTVFSARELAGVLASTSICFDLSVFELFAPLSWGGKVILVDDALALREAARPDEVTLINTVPSAMNELLAHGGLPRSVRTVNLAGEPLQPELVRRIYQSTAVEKVYDLYGPSETTTYSTFTLRTANGRATIGRPIFNTKVYLLDAALEPLPIGVPGELYIGGAGVARGYWRRPELTAERFLRDPFAGNTDARMYRTGDLARYLPDGNIEYLGRADNQVKVRGYRIEPGEIEAALKRHPAVREAVIVARARDSFGETELLGYIVAASESAPSIDQLRGFLNQILPGFMEPSSFVFLDVLPRTPNGKVDRRALPTLDAKRPNLTVDYTAPRTEAEELIAQEWRAALKIDRVGVHDNFFDLGGHSLLAMRVVGRLRAHFNVDLPLRKVFELPTVAGLAEHVERLRQKGSGINIPPIVPGSREQKIPLSFAQRRLWFLHKLDPGLTAYHMPAAYRVHGMLNPPALELALNDMVKRHESLRTAFVEDDGEPVQQIFPAAQLSLALIDLSGGPAADGEAEAAQWLRDQARRPYELGQAPLMRAYLLRLGEKDHIVYLNFHHMIADGTSLAIFYRELAELYDGFLTNSAAALPPLPVQYQDFAMWQAENLRGGRLETQLSYWTRQLGTGSRSFDLPTDFARPALQSYRGARRTKRLSKELSAALKDLSRRQGVTLFMTLLATLKILLARLSGETDIVVGSTVAGRTRPELDGVIGFFINALALRNDLSGRPRFIDLLKRVREVCLDAYAHQDVPFDRIVEELHPRRDLSRNPIFQILFNMAEIAERELKLAGCETVRLHQTKPGAKFDIVIQAPEVDGCIDLVMGYNADLFSEKRIDSMLDQFAHLLSQISAEPERSIDGFSLVTPSALALLPDPTQELDYVWQGSIQGIIARQAKLRPDAPAVSDAAGSWTYGEIDRGSSRLGNALVAGGIEPGDAVAIYARRCAALAPVLLGVLKAGAVFVILDPAYPPARLADYFNIAQPKAWLDMEGTRELSEDIAVALAESELRFRMNLPSGKEELAQSLGEYSDSAPSISIDAETPAYIAFTSGSTGQPKGVVCRHGPMTHFLPWQEEAFGLDHADRYALLSGLAYNHLHRDLFTALASGATLFVPTGTWLKEPDLLVDWLREHEITVLHLTPALGRLLKTAGGKTLPSIRRIFFGGDLLLRDDVRAIHNLAPNAKIVSLYGATETQRAVGYWQATDELVDGAQAKATLPTGRGAPAVQLLLIAARGQLAGVGEVAELHIRSPHLAQGYFNDDGLTAANFLVNPFTGEKRDRLYRTGEMGRYLPDGNVEWVGRIDRRVSIRGFRVELAEVEAALRRCAGVGNAAVVAREFRSDEAAASNESRLVAYVECDPSAAPGVDELRRSMSAYLPHYMVPAYFQIMDRLPLNPNGKVDYSSLPAPDQSEELSDRPLDRPCNDLERELMQIFSRVLGVERIGRQSNFFDLGGHSLIAAQAAARIREQLQVKLDLRTFLVAPTVEALARQVEAMRRSHAAAAVSEFVDREEIEL